jgi:hypothetical protein
MPASLGLVVIVIAQKGVRAVPQDDLLGVVLKIQGAFLRLFLMPGHPVRA